MAVHGIQVRLVYLTRTIPSHCRPVELVAASKAMPIQMYLIRENSLWIQQLSPEILSINTLVVRA